jgi:hypothetical protein
MSEKKISRWWRMAGQTAGEQTDAKEVFELGLSVFETEGDAEAGADLMLRKVQQSTVLNWNSVLAYAKAREDEPAKRFLAAVRAAVNEAFARGAE